MGENCEKFSNLKLEIINPFGKLYITIALFGFLSYRFYLPTCCSRKRRIENEKKRIIPSLYGNV
jgi:hypothetical protein